MSKRSRAIAFGLARHRRRRLAQGLQNCRRYPGRAQRQPEIPYGVAARIHLGNFICWFEGGNR